MQDRATAVGGGDRATCCGDNGEAAQRTDRGNCPLTCGGDAVGTFLGTRLLTVRVTVLSVSAIHDCEGAHGVRYYLSVVANSRDDYYAGRGERPGVWLGMWVAGLGLSGQGRSR
jgi:hypothetical protein